MGLQERKAGVVAALELGVGWWDAVRKVMSRSSSCGGEYDVLEEE